jgi:hypothetical protein
MVLAELRGEGHGTAVNLGSRTYLSPIVTLLLVEVKVLQQGQGQQSSMSAAAAIALSTE